MAQKTPTPGIVSPASPPTAGDNKVARRRAASHRSTADPLSRAAPDDELLPDCDLEEKPDELEPNVRRSGESTPTRRSLRLSDEEFEELFIRWRESGDAGAREMLILAHRNLVAFLARRFADRGESVEDIVQQGIIGLIYALEHFDPAHGVRFATFATPTIIGEIRRYFRDKSRGVRIPRRVQELHHTLATCIETLTQQLGRSPSYFEISQSVSMPVEDVIEALESGRTLEPVSLDDPDGDAENSGASMVDHIGAEDPAITRWDERSILLSALQRLSEKHRMVLQLAYFEDYSQAEIARHLKVSQMHVSRLLRVALAQLRIELEAEEESSASLCS